MASNFNLARNTRVFLTQLVDSSTGVIPSSGTITNAGTTRTTEIAILDGFSFSQASQSTTIQVSEAGSTPTRGQRSFNTALDPVEFSFSTYLSSSGATSSIGLCDRVVWNNLVSDVGIESSQAFTTTSITRASTASATATFVMSTAVNFNSVRYAIDGVINVCTADTSAVGFNNWSGPVRIISVSPSLGAVTTMVGEYLTAPPASEGTAVTSMPSTVLTYRGGYFRARENSSSSAYAELNTAISEKNQLLKSGLIFRVDNAVYAIDNIVIDSATIDFGVDGIATVNWAGKGAALRNITTATISDDAAAVFGGTGLATGTAATALSVNPLANKLSTLTITSGIQGATGTSYSVPLTGGSITISNNSTYLTPSSLRVVNTPVDYFVGSRSITGSLNAYLKTGSGNSANLLTDILAQGTEAKYSIVVYVGGTVGRHVELIMKGVVLQVPTIETADVVSTSIGFTSQGYEAVSSSNTYNIQQPNELVVRAY